MDHGAGPAGGDTVAFGYEIVDVDVNAGEGAVEVAMDGFERLGTSEDRLGLGETVGFALRMEEFVDG